MIKLNESPSGKAKIYLIKDLSELSNLGLNSDEVSYFETKLEKELSSASLNKIGEYVFVVRGKEEYDHLEVEKLRKMGAKIQASVNGEKIETCSISGGANVMAIAEGMVLSGYQFLKYFDKADEKKNSLSTIEIVSGDVTAAEVSELNVVLEATLKARDLVNEPVSYLNAEKLAEELTGMANDSGMKVEVLDHLKIETLKMGGLLSVNAGSVDPATFTILEWKPENAKNSKPIVFVGKGVVYDTGGLSLKPTPNSMDIMKCDMGGAAMVGGAIYAIAKAKLPYHVITLIPATDNRPGGNATAPGDVVTMFNGKTVEVLNTDAEGRMILADALSYSNKLDPELVIDAATLTGAAARAIGSHGIIIMGNAHQSKLDALQVSGDKTFERTVQFPFWDEYGEEMKSKIADLKNLGGPYAGMITAGKFLENFTDSPYIHCDIAGPAWNASAGGYQTFGGSGCGVRLLFDFVKNYA